MKTLLALLVVTIAVAAGYWKTQYPDATLDDVKLGASNTLERAKSGFQTFKDGAVAQNLNGQVPAALDTRVAELEGSLNSRIDALEASLQNAPATQAIASVDNDSGLDATVVNGRLTDAERRLQATDQKLTQINDTLAAIDEKLVPQASANTSDNSDADAKFASVNTAVQALTDQVGTLSSGLDAENESVGQKFASIDTTLETLTSEIGVVSGSVSSITDGSEQQFTGLKTTVDALAEQIDTVSSSLGNLNDNVAASVGEREAMTTELAALKSSVESLSRLVAEQDDEQTLTNIGAFESRIDTLSVSSNPSDSEDGNLTALVDKRLQSLEEKLSSADADVVRVNTLAERLDDTNEQLTALSTEQRTVNEQVAALSATQQATANAKSVANNRAENTNGRIAKLLTQLESNAERTAELEARLDEANVQLASMSEELAAVRTQAGTGSSSIESLQAELNTQLESSLVTARNRIQQLESRVQSLPTGDSEAATAQLAQDELQKLIENMEQRFRELPAATDQKQVAELRDRGANSGVEYTVYFGLGSIDISPEAGEILKDFIRQEQNRTTGVSIYGFTDRRGDAGFNQRLALARATSVRSFLITNGFDFTKIKSLSGLGEDAAAATLDDGVADADQRAVVLVADQR